MKLQPIIGEVSYNIIRDDSEDIPSDVIAACYSSPNARTASIEFNAPRILEREFEDEKSAKIYLLTLAVHEITHFATSDLLSLLILEESQKEFLKERLALLSENVVLNLLTSKEINKWL